MQINSFFKMGVTKTEGLNFLSGYAFVARNWTTGVLHREIEFGLSEINTFVRGDP